MRKPVILVVEDDASLRFVLDECLKRKNYTTVLAGNGQQAIRLYESCSPDLVLLDIKLPKINGLKVMEQLKVMNPDISIIILTGHATINIAVEAMKKGASDFITKPFEVDELLAAVEDAMQKIQINKENAAARETCTSINEQLYSSKVCSTSIAIEEIISNIAASDYTVLLEGESGTGKSLLAREIHNRSNRKEGPFVLVDCASLPDNLIESELFGYEKGAFTGAISRKIGKIERADQGTLFLDEISTLNLNAQANLLTVIQNREFERLGGNKPQTVDIRIIAASNQNLKQMIKEKTFRRDLYYRLNVFSVVIPPLRERREDIIPMAYFFISRFGSRNEIILSIDSAMKLRNYDWPGNIRELENCIKHALILIKDKNIIEPIHLPLDLTPEFLVQKDKNLGLKEVVEKAEKLLIEQALLEHDFNIETCAEALKISRRTLYYRINKLDIYLPSNRMLKQ